MTLTAYMCQGKKEEESWPAFKIALMHKLKQCWERLFTDTRNNTNINRTKISGKQKWEEKQLNGNFNRQTSEISHEKTWTWLRKGNHERENESLLIKAQNNAIRTNYVVSKIDKMQQNSKCRLCDDRDKTINHILSKCSKLAHKEYKTRHDWVGMMIHWKLCKKLKFDHKNKWYVHNTTSWRIRRRNFSGILIYKRIT